ncbi:MAG: hypothetical protein JSR91_00220 [Proteobacteria bacterium]|nr:hypothetical protein [Pseudomonadota bacterium]
MSNMQDIEVFAGENRTLALAARDASNLPVDLTGSTVAWYVGRGPRWPCNVHPLITKTATLTTPASGLFSVAVDPSDTQYAQGDFAHEAHMTDADGNVTMVCMGRFRVRPAMVP